VRGFETALSVVRAWRPDEADRVFDMLSRLEVFDDGHDELWAVTHTTNAPSQAGCRRLGMRHMGFVEGLWYVGARTSSA